MNSPATARIALAAILIFSATIAIGAEKKPAAPDKKKSAPARKTGKSLPAPPATTPNDAERLRSRRVEILLSLALHENPQLGREKAITHLRAAAALCDQTARPIEWLAIHSALAETLDSAGQFNPNAAIVVRRLRRLRRFMELEGVPSWDGFVPLLNGARPSTSVPMDRDVICGPKGGIRV